jgi:hypothetical protein
LVIPADLSAKILRLYKAERWRVGTIARQLHVHRDTVRRVLAQAGDPAPVSPLRPSLRISANVTGDFGNVTDIDRLLGCAGEDCRDGTIWAGWNTSVVSLVGPGA